jgi:hypothetical protein
VSTAPFQLPDPYHTTFMRCALILLEDLTAYNVPRPVGEGQWFSWAVQLFAIPELLELGLTDPRGFSNWQDWMASLLQVSN